MDLPLLSPSAPRLVPIAHSRTPSRSPTRVRITDDILSDLSPSTTLEAFTNPSGRLKASIEAASPTERAFGIRATLASKKLQEWVDELSQWSWPASEGSAGFEIPVAKRRKLSPNRLDGQGHRNGGREDSEREYSGSLPVEDIIQYVTRIEEITEDMEDLNVEEIKSQVLDSHFSPKSRPSSSASSAPMPNFLAYTRMDDFTAIVTATVLHALPNLSRLMRLMEVWSIRLSILQKVPPLLLALNDAEVALKSGWMALDMLGGYSPARSRTQEPEMTDETVMSRHAFQVMRDVLQDKVTALGKDLDFMLDTLEGRQDTLPDSWLDRMEAIEQDYGEWVVAGDRKVREGEWARMAEARKAREGEWARMAEASKKKEIESRLDEKVAAEAARQQVAEDAVEAEVLQGEGASGRAAVFEMKRLEAEESAERDLASGTPDSQETTEETSHFTGMNQYLAAASAAVGLESGDFTSKSRGQARSEVDTEKFPSSVVELARFDEGIRQTNEPNSVPENPSQLPTPGNRFNDQTLAQNTGWENIGLKSFTKPHTTDAEEMPATVRRPLSTTLNTDCEPSSSSNEQVNRSLEEESPSSLVKVPRFGHVLGNVLRRSSSPQLSNESRPTPSGSRQASPASILP